MDEFWTDFRRRASTSHGDASTALLKLRWRIRQLDRAFRSGVPPFVVDAQIALVAQAAVEKLLCSKFKYGTLFYS